MSGVLDTGRNLKGSAPQACGTLPSYGGCLTAQEEGQVAGKKSLCLHGNTSISKVSSPGRSQFPPTTSSSPTTQHSFTVQYYANGSEMGDLDLFGSFSQKCRGPVGTYNPTTQTQVSGYVKKYVYDTRLRYASPPYFLDPIHAAWGVKTFGELAAKYQGS